MKLMAILLGMPDVGGYEIVRANWHSTTAPAEFETLWNTWLNDGLVAGSAAKPIAVTLAADATKQTTAAASGGMEIIFRPDPYLWDGRYANNGWLMEVPRPLTQHLLGQRRHHEPQDRGEPQDRRA